jgi:hypothetical protein
MRLALMVALALLLVSVAHAQVDPAFNDTRLKVPSAELQLFFQQQPVVVDGAVMVPLPAVERWLKTVVQRSDDDGKLIIKYYGETATPVNIEMRIGEKQAVLGRMEVTLDAAPRKIGETVYLPLRFIAEAVGVWVDAFHHEIRLKKPDLDWECWFAVPPHPKSLQGKLVALAVARGPGKLKRVQNVWLSADTNMGQVVIAEPPSAGGDPVKTLLTYQRDATGWHFLSQMPWPG